VATTDGHPSPYTPQLPGVPSLSSDFQAWFSHLAAVPLPASLSPPSPLSPASSFLSWAGGIKDFSAAWVFSWVLILPGNELDDFVQYICDCFGALDYITQRG